MSVLFEKYADLLVNYCVSLQPNQQLLIDSTTLAEPLVREIYRYALRAGGIPHVKMAFRDQADIFNQEAHTDQQLRFVEPVYADAMMNFEAYIYVRAPFYSRAVGAGADAAKSKIINEAHTPYRNRYFERTGNYTMKRNLCEYPTIANAQNAGLTLEAYADFIYNACYLYEENPAECWRQVSRNQQHIVDKLNQCQEFRYKGEGTDLRFKTHGRIWINSDGKTNMPSGEVYTSPVEDSVNGVVHFSYPSMFAGEEVEGITLWVKDGWVEKWEAKKGKHLLDKIFQIEGARRFGEAAIGTNTRIPYAVKNILFDEKIGGTIHLAVGQSYIQTNGKNQSSVHWDMIADMTNGGEIYANDEKVYENGKFIF